ncbi:MAG: isoprenyl synthetase [Candidatus Marinimicrobia bacterium]|nr:isoprenyl synthetase [Candidatus Neomarinimicrobiota bacterium]|tara:strand:+ start:8045 stop:9016 length:972 start_codon:yes stop_codon:yes gene_type:complete
MGSLLKMKFKDEIKLYKSMIDENLKKVYESGPINIKEPIYHILKGGKRIRPILSLITADACGLNPEEAVDASISIELLHNFTLIHDDIMDNDDLRHGNETIHKKWNDSIAILSGDAMLAIALLKLNEIPKYSSSIIKKFNEGLIEVCEGQALDLYFQDKEIITENDYLKMIHKKTGFMIGLSAEIGAILANADKNTQNEMKKYGFLIGRAFQIQDDLLEIISNKSKMGKTLESDFLLNKKTYLSIKSRLIDNEIINTFIDIAKNDFEKGFMHYKEFLQRNNIIEETEETISEILNKADKILIDLEINRKNLFDYTKFILNRKH